MRITFALKRPNAESSTIILLVSLKGQRLKYYTGYSVQSKNFPSNIGYIQIKLDELKKALETANSHFALANKPFTKKEAIRILDTARGKKTTVQAFDYFDIILDEMRSGTILTPKNKFYTKGSIKRFKSFIELLKEFDPEFSFDFDLNTYNSFINFCHKKEFTLNYIGALIGAMKTMLKLAQKKGYHDNDYYEKYRKMAEDTVEVYLNDNEIDTIYKLKELSPRRELVRDWFVLGCYVGLRVSDLTRLTKQNLSKGFITIGNEKTGVTVIIPVHPKVKEIVSKYKGLPPRVTDVEINRMIKKIAETAELKEDVLVSQTKGGKRVETYFKKWQMVSTHTCRRSFVTNLRKAQVPDNIVMKLAGMKSMGTLKKYDRLTNDEAAKIAAGMSYFK